MNTGAEEERNQNGAGPMIGIGHSLLRGLGLSDSGAFLTAGYGLLLLELLLRKNQSEKRSLFALRPATKRRTLDHLRAKLLFLHLIGVDALSSGSQTSLQS